MASDSRIFCILSIFFVILLSLKSCENKNVQLHINTRKAMHRLSPYFLSLSLDPTLFLEEEKGKFVTDKYNMFKAVNMAKGLSPAFLRFGGPSTDLKKFRFEAFSFIGDRNSSKGHAYEGSKAPNVQITLSGAQLLLLNHFAEEAGLKLVLCLGYNLMKKETHLMDDNNDNIDKNFSWYAWDSKEATDIIRFADSMNISLGYQLGYEVDYINITRNLKNRGIEFDYQGVPKNIEKYGLDGLNAEEEANKFGTTLGNDIVRLRTILNAFPNSRGSMILSPGIRLPAEFCSFRTFSPANYRKMTSTAGLRLSSFLQSFLEESGKALTSVVWHPSAFSLERKEHGILSPIDDTLETLYEKDGLHKLIGSSIANKPIWIGESWSDDDVNRPISNSEEYKQALVWAQHLGMAARMGSQVVLHSPKSSALHRPNPQYWVSLLHKKLAGVLVLDAQLSDRSGVKNDVQFFAHCTPQSLDSLTSTVDKFPHGSVTVYAVNPTNTSMDTFFRVISGFTNLFYENLYKGLSPPEIHEYVLTPETEEGNPDKYTGRTLLNGKVLELERNGALPYLTPNLLKIRVQDKYRGDDFLSRMRKETNAERKKSRMLRAKRSHKMIKQHSGDSNQFGFILTVPPNSVTFWVLPPSVGVRPCLEEENDAEEEGMMIGSNDYHSRLSMNDNEETNFQRGRRSMEKRGETVDEVRGINKGRQRRHPNIHIKYPSNDQITSLGLHEIESVNFENRRKSVSRRGASKRKDHKESNEELEKFYKRQQKEAKKKKKKKQAKKGGPKVLSYDLEDENSEEINNAYAKGTVYLSDDVESYDEKGSRDQETTRNKDYDYGENFDDGDNGEFDDNQRKLQFDHGPGGFYSDNFAETQRRKIGEKSSRELFEVQAAGSDESDDNEDFVIINEDKLYEEGIDKEDGMASSKLYEKPHTLERNKDYPMDKHFNDNDSMESETWDQPSYKSRPNVKSVSNADMARDSKEIVAKGGGNEEEKPGDKNPSPTMTSNAEDIKDKDKNREIWNAQDDSQKKSNVSREKNNEFRSKSPWISIFGGESNEDEREHGQDFNADMKKMEEVNYKDSKVNTDSDFTPSSSRKVETSQTNDRKRRDLAIPSLPMGDNYPPSYLKIGESPRYAHSSMVIENGLSSSDGNKITDIQREKEEQQNQNANSESIRKGEEQVEKNTPKEFTFQEKSNSNPLGMYLSENLVNSEHDQKEMQTSDKDRDIVESITAKNKKSLTIKTSSISSLNGVKNNCIETEEIKFTTNKKPKFSDNSDLGTQIKSAQEKDEIQRLRRESDKNDTGIEEGNNQEIQSDTKSKDPPKSVENDKNQEDESKDNSTVSVNKEIIPSIALLPPKTPLQGTIKEKLSSQLSTKETKPLKLKKDNEEEKAQMKAQRKQAAEARLKALEAIRKVIEENTRRIKSGLTPTVGEVQDPDIALSLEKLRTAFDKIRESLRIKREAKRLNSATKSKSSSRSKKDYLYDIQRDNRDKREVIPDPKDADDQSVHKRVPRRVTEEGNYRIPRSNPSLDEKTTLNQNPSETCNYGDDDFVEMLAGGRAGKVRGTVNLWPEKIVEPSSAFPNTAGLYGMQEVDQEYPDSNEFIDFQVADKFNYQTTDAVENVEDNLNKEGDSYDIKLKNSKEREGIHYLDYPGADQPNNEKEMYGVDMEEMNEKRSRRSISKSRKPRNLNDMIFHPYSYEVNEISGGKNLLDNKIMKYANDVDGKGNLMLVLLNDNSLKKKNKKRVQWEMKSLTNKDKGINTNDETSKNRNEYKIVTNFTEIDGKNGGVIQKMFQKTEFVTENASISPRANVNVERVEDKSGFISEIFKHISEVMKCIQNMLVWNF